MCQLTKTAGNKIEGNDMAFTYNQVILLGNVGKDPEFVQLDNGNQIATLSLATTSSYKDKNGEWVDNTDWHIIKAFGNIAKLMQYVKKGHKLQVIGQLKNNHYEDDAGVKHYAYFVRADRIILLEKIEKIPQEDLNNNVIDDEGTPF